MATSTRRQGGDTVSKETSHSWETIPRIFTVTPSLAPAFQCLGKRSLATRTPGGLMRWRLAGSWWKRKSASTEVRISLVFSKIKAMDPLIERRPTVGTDQKSQRLQAACETTRHEDGGLVQGKGREPARIPGPRNRQRLLPFFVGVGPTGRRSDRMFGQVFVHISGHHQASPHHRPVTRECANILVVTRLRGRRQFERGSVA